MAISKFKPTQIPRLFDSWSSDRNAMAKKTVQDANSAVLRSKELIAQSREIIAKIKKAIRKKAA